MIVAFTGHRDMSRYNESAVKRAMLRETEKLNPTRTIIGCAVGWDFWAGWLSVHIDVPFTAAIPFEGFDAYWTTEQREELARLLAKAAEVVVVSKPTGQERRQYGGLNKYYQSRNVWMVDHSDQLVAGWDKTRDKSGKPTGTKNCVTYARIVDKPVVVIDPRKP